MRKLPFAGYSFFNPYKADFEPVNVDELVERFESGAEVSPDTLYTVGLIGAAEDLVVVLGRGELDRPLQIEGASGLEIGPREGRGCWRLSRALAGRVAGIARANGEHGDAGAAH